MRLLNALTSRTLTVSLIVFGLMTCFALLFAVDINLLPVVILGVDFTPSSAVLIRHWGIMIFGVGALMVTAAFKPFLTVYSRPMSIVRLRTHREHMEYGNIHVRKVRCASIHAETRLPQFQVRLFQLWKWTSC